MYSAYSEMDHQNQLDNKPLSPGPFTFTRERIESILRDNCIVHNPKSRFDAAPTPFAGNGLGLPGDHQSSGPRTQKGRDVMFEEFCTQLYDLTQDEESHVSHLDDAFSTLVIGNF